MTRKEAEALIIRVQKETAGKVKTSIEHVRQSDRGYQVKLLLRPRLLTLMACEPKDWDSIKQAWHWFLYGKEAPPQEHSTYARQGRYLVDGKAMYITRSKDGYWRGMTSDNGKIKSKYFGKTDPRGQFTIVEEGKETVKV